MKDAENVACEGISQDIDPMTWSDSITFATHILQSLFLEWNSISLIVQLITMIMTWFDT